MSDHDLIRRGDALRIVDEDDTAAFAYEQIRALPAVSPGVMPEVAALVEALSFASNMDATDWSEALDVKNQARTILAEISSEAALNKGESHE